MDEGVGDGKRIRGLGARKRETVKICITIVDRNNYARSGHARSQMEGMAQMRTQMQEGSRGEGKDREATRNSDTRARGEKSDEQEGPGTGGGQGLNLPSARARGMDRVCGGA